MAVVDAMQRQLAAPQTDNRPAFLYLLGNIVFYYGEASNYYGQFYNPYAHYTAPIFAIPGNHDGQLPLGVAGPRSLEAFMENFCATKPHVTPEAGGLPRSAMTEPNAYWTLQAPFATIIGLYTNVPEGGALDSGQREWLRNEMASAPRDKALIIALHHSPFSFSKTGPRGSAQMVQELQDAINSSHRVPNAVLSATTMNYQRIEVPVAGTKIPFIVVGNGGYFTTHRLAERPGYVDPKSGAQLLAGRDDVHGFATIEISASTISGRFISAPNTNNSDSDNVADTFTYSASPIVVAPGQAVRLTPVLQKTVEED
jgi:hypothetical protein